MESINISLLGFGEKLSICWSFLWRGILITLGSMIVGGILGGLIGFLIVVSGVTKQTGMPVVQVLGFGVGFLSGCGFLYVYIRWLLSSRLGKFRLVLILADGATNRSVHATASAA
jgi:ABC-type amino acid transport system permease subunit